MKKTLIITVATLALIAAAAACALFTLTAAAGPHQTCSKVDPAELRAVADPNYAENLQELARCGRELES